MGADLLDEIAENVIKARVDKNSPFGKEKAGEPGVMELTQRAIEEGIEVQAIIDHGLLAGMNVVGARFKGGEVFIPEVIISSQALRAGMAILRPLIGKSGIQPASKVVIGTVKGDLHDIGKGLVAMMLEGAQFEVVDLGTDVSAEAFVEAVKREKPHILGLSSLLTSTMPEMETVTKAFEQDWLRDTVKIIVGGAPVNQEFADQIGADAYAVDAISAVERAKELLSLT